MMKLVVFLGGAVAGFALSSSMTDEQRDRMIGRARKVTKSPAVEKLSDAAHTVTGAVSDAATTKVQAAADAVANAVSTDDTPPDTAVSPV